MVADAARIRSAVVRFRSVAARLVIGGLLGGSAISASGVVFTTDYDRMTVLPVLSGNPADQDWRVHGVVTPVKNEGPCDASWAFAVTGLVEGDSAIRTGSLSSLSEQELLDCTDSGSACTGGSPIAAMRTLIARGGLATEAAYPYKAVAGICKATTAIATIPGAGRVPPGDEVSLQNYVDRGPVLALINESPAVDSYRGGIFTGPCNATNPTQAVLIVGYATNAGVDYWIVKNSLGPSWGASGYIYLVRHENICGIANFAVAVSNDPLPAPIAPAVPTPTLNQWGTGLLLVGVAALASLSLRGWGVRKFARVFIPSDTRDR
ncbi:MAG TPA: C1 family peptidase [Casimicrobiaceae bacterium]|nr:C1 family peptidase [Casimicrobiaceae bacterium]